MTPDETYAYALAYCRALHGRDPDSGEVIDALCKMASEAWDGGSRGYHRRLPAQPARPPRPQRPQILDGEPETATE